MCGGGGGEGQTILVQSWPPTRPAAEERRVAALHVAARYSELKAMSNEALADQRKVHKQRRKAAKQPVTCTVTQKNRLAYVLTLQGLLTEAEGGQPRSRI